MSRQSVLAFLGLAALVSVALLWNAEPSRAQADPHSVFLHVRGQGPTATAWYKGAPPAGILVQEALDRFSGQGYRIVRVTDISLPTIIVTDSGQASPASIEPFYVVFMEK